jgi:hypothetical protein
MRTIEFRGKKVEYDEKCLKSWKWQKCMASGDLSRGIDAISRLLNGRDEEYADLFDDDAEAMQALVIACLEDSNTAKN